MIITNRFHLHTPHHSLVVDRASLLARLIVSELGSPALTSVKRSRVRIVVQGMRVGFIVTSEPQAVRRHAAEDLGAACAGRVAPHLANAKSVY